MRGTPQKVDDTSSDPVGNHPVPVLPWTGERFIPTEGGPEIYYEHAHRYVVARALLAGSQVVDLASGEGYGAAWLADVAESVFGIDIDVASVQHAKARYAQHRNLEFAVGDIQALPFADSSADAVTCFEAIEHVENPRAVVEEVVRVLRPGGLLLVSTPNKAVYADERDYNNEFHIHEFYLPDLELLLGEYFSKRDLLGQRVVAGSLTWRLPDSNTEGAAEGATGIFVAPGFVNSGTREPPAMVEPMYVLAACRLAGNPRIEAELPAASVLVDPEELLLEVYRQSGEPAAELAAHIRQQDAELDRARAQLAAYEEQATVLRRRIRELDEQPATLDDGAGVDGANDASSLRTALFTQQELSVRLARDLDAATELNLRLLAEMRAQHRSLARLQYAEPARYAPATQLSPVAGRLVSKLTPKLHGVVRRARRLVARA